MTDLELIEYLATRAMGWIVYDASAHRPGSRALPYAWRWWRAPEDVVLGVYDGTSSREWNPLENEGDAAALSAAVVAKGLSEPTGGTPREIATAAAELIAAAEPTPPTE